MADNNVPETVNEIERTIRELRSSVAGYAAMRRLLAASMAAESPVSPPLFGWTAELNGDTVEVITDFTGVDKAAQNAVFAAFGSAHANSMLSRAKLLNELSSSLVRMLEASK